MPKCFMCGRSISATQPWFNYRGVPGHTACGEQRSSLVDILRELLEALSMPWPEQPEPKGPRELPDKFWGPCTPPKEDRDA